MYRRHAKPPVVVTPPKDDARATHQSRRVTKSVSTRVDSPGKKDLWHRAVLPLRSDHPLDPRGTEDVLPLRVVPDLNFPLFPFCPPIPSLRFLRVFFVVRVVHV